MTPLDPSRLPDARTLARGLGWFSIALGAAELLAPGSIRRGTGVPGPQGLVPSYGAREVATGVALLAARDPVPLVWGRVAGDLLDIATLLPALGRDNPRRAGAASALGVVLLATAADLAVATRGDRSSRSQEAPKSPILYGPGVEYAEPDEGETIDAIIDAMAKGGEVTRQRHGRAIRTSHAKAHALLKAELRVEPGLPPELAQGLFASARSYPAILRLSHVPGEFLDDRRVSTPRGMSLKVLGVEGPLLHGHDAPTQDFVLDTGKAFNAPDARAFLAAISATEASAALPEGVKAAVSTASRATNAALHAVGLHSKNLDFYGHPVRHPLSEAYFSQIPLRYGDHVAKLAVIPESPEMLALLRQPFKPQDEDGLRTAVAAFIGAHGARFRVAVQLCTDPDRMPVEDASAVWPESLSPYRIVARLTVAPQEAWSPARADYEESLLFCPAHSLAAHRLLGSIGRARLRAYEALGNARRQSNARPLAEPRDLAEMPD